MEMERTPNTGQSNLPVRELGLNVNVEAITVASEEKESEPRGK